MPTTEPAPYVDGRRGTTLLWCALAGPGTLLATIMTASLVLPLWGVDVLWHAEPLTLAEAAALNDVAEIVRLIEAGEDANRPAPVRAGFLMEEGYTLTPLEAAVGSGREEVLGVLLDKGARLDAATWTRLYCLAAEGTSVREFLMTRQPAGATSSCVGVETPW